MNHPSLGEFTFVRIIFCDPTTLGHPSTPGQPLPLSMTRRLNISLLTTGDQDQLSSSSKTPTAVDPDVSYKKKNEFFHVKEWRHLPDPRFLPLKLGVQWESRCRPLQCSAPGAPRTEVCTYPWSRATRQPLRHGWTTSHASPAPPRGNSRHTLGS